MAGYSKDDPYIQAQIAQCAPSESENWENWCSRSILPAKAYSNGSIYMTAAGVFITDFGCIGDPYW